VAPLVLDLPAVHFSHDSFGGSLPIVPAPHASKPDGAEALILDPSGTTTEADPPLATIDPASTGKHFDCSGSGCKYPAGQSSQSSLLLDPTLSFIFPAAHLLHSSPAASAEE
jgi:hypothetical protein